MGFYYFSIFSFVPLGIAYGLLFLALWGIARLTRGMPGRTALLGVLGAVFLVLPISEELWIAWNFGQACKQAGTFINKKVQVDGFYDDAAGGTSLDLVRPGNYRFIESRDNKGFTRLTFGDANLLQEALSRFEQENSGKEGLKQDVVRVKLDDRTEVLVFPKKGDSWRITHLDRPSAQYWFAVDQGQKVAHKVDKQQSTVTDIQSGELLARYARYSREAPWYFISLGRPNQGCDGPEGGPHSKHTFLIYRDVLLPAGSTTGVSK